MTRNKWKKKYVLISGLICLISLLSFNCYCQKNQGLLYIALQDINESGCTIQLQIAMKPLCLDFEKLMAYTNDLETIDFNPYRGSWTSSDFINVVRTNDVIIEIKTSDLDCLSNKKWQCRLAPISFNSDSTLALIQYQKIIPFASENETGSVLYKLSNGKWIKHFTIETSSFKNIMTQ